jgi:probable rRNA maturation factor
MRINIQSMKGLSRASSKKIRTLVRRVLANEKRKFETVNVILTDNEYLRGLNREYFKKNRATNVISFDLGDVAEIYVSEEQARYVYELYYFIVHGLLHTIGYDHHKRNDSLVMSKKCREYLADE